MAILSEEEKEKLKQIIKAYPNNEDLDLTAFIAEVIGITGIHTEEGWYDQDINETHITFYFMSDEDTDFSEDTNESEEYYIQVDIWSKEDCFRLSRRLRSCLRRLVLHTLRVTISTKKKRESTIKRQDFILL